MDDFTALIVPLEDHSDAIQSFRRRHVHVAAVDLPPHISIFYPFLGVPQISSAVRTTLQTIADSCFPAPYELVTTGRFEEARVLYLDPSPRAVFDRAFSRIRSEFSSLRPAFENPHMHLTLAQSDQAHSLNELSALFAEKYAARLPIRTTAKRISLYHKSGGVWRFVEEWVARGPAR